MRLFHKVAYAYLKGCNSIMLHSLKCRQSLECKPKPFSMTEAEKFTWIERRSLIFNYVTSEILQPFRISLFLKLLVHKITKKIRPKGPGAYNIL